MPLVPPPVTVFLPMRRTPHPPGAWPDSPIDDNPGTSLSNLPSVDRPIPGQDSTLDYLKDPGRQFHSMLGSPTLTAHTQSPNQPVPKNSKGEYSPRRLETSRTGMMKEDGRRIYIPQYAASGHGKSCTGRSATPSSAKSRLSSRADSSRRPSTRQSLTSGSTSPPPWYVSPESPVSYRPASSTTFKYAPRPGPSREQSSQHYPATYTRVISERLSSHTPQNSPIKRPNMSNNLAIKDTYPRAREDMPLIQQTIGEEKTSTETTREGQPIHRAIVNNTSQFIRHREGSSLSENSSLTQETAIPRPEGERQSHKSKIFKSIRRWSFVISKHENRKLMEKVITDEALKKEGGKSYEGSLGRRFARVLRRKDKLSLAKL